MRDLGPYDIIRPLGRGGMGTVYLASRRGAQGFVKPVAVKLMHPEYAEDSTATQMFVEEAKLLSRMSHPHIVSVLDFFLADDTFALVFEYIEGVDLERLVLHSHLSFAEVAYIGDCLWQALAYAHTNAEAVHRDVATPNVLISINGEVKLGDFGIARVSGNRNLTREGVVRGRLRCMAPEVMRGARASFAADVFSAALLLFELWSGKSLRGHGEDLALIEKLRHEPLPDLRSAWPQMSLPLQVFFGSALAVDPAQRFANGELALRAFRDAIGPREPDAQVRDRLAARVRNAGDSPPGNTRTDTLDAAGVVASPAAKKTSREKWWAWIAPVVIVMPVALWALRTPSPSPMKDPAGPSAAGALPSSLPASAPSSLPDAPSATTEPRSAVVAVKPIGFLTVNSEPWAYVIIDGKRLNKTTPLVRWPLPEGPHAVLLVNAEGNELKRLSVRIEAGKTTTRLEQLR